MSITAKGYMHQYVVVGRHKVDEANPTPKLFRMKLFASNKVIARSRFWYYMKLLRKIKRQNGEIVSVSEVANVLETMAHALALSSA